MIGEQLPRGHQGNLQGRRSGVSPVPTGRVEEGPHHGSPENRPRLLRTRRGCRPASQRRGKSGPALWEHPCQLDMRGRKAPPPRHCLARREAQTCLAHCSYVKWGSHSAPLPQYKSRELSTSWGSCIGLLPHPCLGKGSLCRSLLVFCVLFLVS